MVPTNSKRKLGEKKEVINLVSPVKKKNVVFDLVSSEEDEKPRRSSKSSSRKRRNSRREEPVASPIKQSGPRRNKHLVVEDEEPELGEDEKIKKSRSSSSLTRKNNAATTIQLFGRRATRKHKASQKAAQRLASEKATLKKQKQSVTRLRSFFRKTVFAPDNRHKVRTKFLKSICSDSGVCIAFGKEEEKIKQFFDNFTDFKYNVSRRKIGAQSNNGFVYELTYERDDYLAHAVLKSASTRDADNLSYEYFVGKIINDNFLKKLPCFVETYGLYQYTIADDYKKMRNNTSVNSLQSFLSMFTETSVPPLSEKKKCLSSIVLCILTQNIKNAKTVKSMLDAGPGRTHSEVSEFVINDLAGCLFQVYFALDDLRDSFTHYDLHYQNVLLFEPVVNKYINYNYIGRDGSACSFKSKYIVKIIDYGRSFIISPTGEGSVTEYQRICAEPFCKPHCGEEVGYYWMNPVNNNPNINSCTTKNNTKDLWLLSILKKYKSVCPLPLVELFDKLNFGDGTQNSSVGYPHRIFNVSDAKSCLSDIINSVVEVQKNNAYYLPYTNLGTLTISSGVDMNYVHATP